MLTSDIKTHWQQLRQMTYDLMEHLQDEDLQKTLPFEQSQSLGNQFYCMLGTQESFIPYIETGEWVDWQCSIGDWHTATRDQFRTKMKQADDKLIKLLESNDLLKPFTNGKSALTHYLTLAEHESHHQGQLINFIYALNLRIPQSWYDKWHLTREEKASE